MNAETPILQFDAVTAGYRHHPVLHEISLSIQAGECLALLGPNGVGKTTWLKVATGLLPCQSGQVRLLGESIKQLSAVQRARMVGVVAQQLTTPMAFSVDEMVMMGRTSRLGRWTAPGKADYAAVEEALEMTGTLPLRRRSFPTLSGGEKQRVSMAMALAGEPRVLLLDEPSSHLDLGHRMDLIRLIRRINKTRQLTIVMIVHDLNLAAECFPRLVMMDKGRIVADGTPEVVLGAELLQRVYGCKVTVQYDTAANCLRVFPLF